MAVLPTPGSPMSAGLFLVRRDRIWMTRSISFSRPMTGSILPARTASVRLMPSWSTVGVLLARLVSASGLAELDWERTRMTSWRTLSRLTPRDSRTPAAMPSPFADQAQQQVLGADVVVAQPAGLVDGQLDDALGARGQADLADDRAIAAADDELDRGPDLGELDVHVLEHARSDALALADEAEQQVLGADVVVVEPLRLVLRKRQDLARAVRELVESIHRSNACSLPERLPAPLTNASIRHLPPTPDGPATPAMGGSVSGSLSDRFADDRARAVRNAG